MIKIAKLEKMVQAELAADGWWDGLSDKEKKAYVRAHPKSKYAGSRERAVTPRGQDFHTARSNEHGKQKDRHLRKMSFHERMADKTTGGASRLHKRAAKAHDVAYRAHDRAQDAHTNVETPEESNRAMAASHTARKRTAVAQNMSADSGTESPKRPSRSWIKVHAEQGKFHAQKADREKDPAVKNAHSDAEYAHRMALKAHMNDRPDAEKQSAFAMKASKRANMIKSFLRGQKRTGGLSAV